MDTTVAILDDLERLTKEISKLTVGRSLSPRRQYKSRLPSLHHPPNLTTLLPRVNKFEFCCEQANSLNNSSH